nr:MAG TPA: hypothetical protein [Caudoviricetes sp.]
MTLSRNYNTPVPYWLSLNFRSLAAWIEESNSMVQELNEAQKKRQK